MKNLSAAVSQHLQRRTKSSCSALLCQQVAPALIHQAVKSGKRSSLNSLGHLPTFSISASTQSRPPCVLFLNQGCDVELVYCIFTHPFQISSIQSRNFSLMLKFRLAILFLDMSVYLLKIFFSNNACKDFTCSALVYPFILVPFT